MEGVDAFSQNWGGGELNWCNHPWVLLSQLMRFLYDLPKVEAALMALDWPHAIWFAPLNQLAMRSILIPCQDELFVPGHPGMEMRFP